MYTLGQKLKYKYGFGYLDVLFCSINPQNKKEAIIVVDNNQKVKMPPSSVDIDLLKPKLDLGMW